MILSMDILAERCVCFERILDACTLCPRRCGINRHAGERGFCGLSDVPRVSCALPHHGEEPPLSGRGGAGTVFFSSCTLGCRYCQNYQISLEGCGEECSPHDLAGMMLSLQKQGCENIDAVTPTPHLYSFVQALSIAAGKGLSLPIIYNTSGYEDVPTLSLLEGIVDVYLPDFKYGDDRFGSELSGVGDYVACAISAIEEMVRQVGCGLETVNGVARRGIIVRHLVLPGMIDNSLKALNLIKRHVSTDVSLSIMAQYTPISAVKQHPLLGRCVTDVEYRRVVEAALDMGFQSLFIQDGVCDGTGVPDFGCSEPFKW